jgi:sugar/nucleoside kinase (ribokinase family)
VAASSADLRTPEGRQLLALADLVSLNQDEAGALAGRPFVPGDASSFFGSLPAGGRLVVTAGSAGAFGWDGRALAHVPALSVPVASTAGAGDAVLGGLITGLAAGLPLFPTSSRPLAERPVESGLDLGVCLAAYAVASPHTIPEDVGWARLRSFLAPLGVRFGPALEGLTRVAA